MMADKAWKRNERVAAKRLGGERVGPVGDIGSDVAHPLFAIECKERKKPLPAEIRDAISQSVGAARPDQLPIVIWHTLHHRHDEDVVMMRLRDFENWAGKVEEGQGG